MKKRKVVTLAVSLLLVTVMGLAVGCSNVPTGASEYTLNEYQPGSPDTWNPHTWQTSTDSYILTYNTIGLYDVAMNNAKDGYRFVPEMAAAEPVDVTSTYATANNVYGIPVGKTTGYAFKIALNPNAKWENGDVINADTYVDSMQKLLDPAMLNRRADSYYMGSLVLANASNYFKQLGAQVFDDVAYLSTEDFKTIKYRDIADKDLYVSTTVGSYFFGGTPMSAYYAHPNYKEGFTVDGKDLFPDLHAKCEATRTGMIPLTDEIKAWLTGVAANFGDKDANAYKQMSFYVAKDETSAETPWENVGIKKTGEYEITLITAKPISDFYLHYSLTSNWIVHKKTYEDNIINIGENFKKTKYCTTFGTTMSYGPYKLSTYQADKQIVLTKNDQWYGWTDNNHDGQFQTTRIVCDIIDESTAFDQFLKGNFDTVSLSADDYEAYKSSAYMYILPDSSTASIAINTDVTKLTGRQDKKNQGMLSLPSFRKAISYSVNRANFVGTLNPVAKPGLGLLNEAYIVDPENGTPYRETQSAKEAILRLYNVQYTAATVDAEYAKLTGYDPTLAKRLFAEAFEEGKTKGLYSESNNKGVVELEYLVYTTGDWELWATLVRDDIKSVLEGTPYEGKVNIVTKADQDYTNTMLAGSSDMCRAMWSGSAMDPFSIMEVYLKDTLNYSYGYDGTAHNITIKVDGADKTMSIQDWHTALNGSENNKDIPDYSQLPIDVKTSILAEMEYTLLSDFSTIPLYSRQTANLRSKQIKFGSDEYLTLIEFGGIRYITYNMNDSEWATFTSKSSNLNYK